MNVILTILMVLGIICVTVGFGTLMCYLATKWEEKHIPQNVYLDKCKDSNESLSLDDLKLTNGIENKPCDKKLIITSEDMLLIKSDEDIIIVPHGITRKELHKKIFGIDPPELDSPYLSCANSVGGCDVCKHKEDLNCDKNWWNAPYRNETIMEDN